MLSVAILTVTFAVTNVVGYHDPDLNYHLSQLQKLPDCNTNGYSYPRPAVHFAASGVKVAAAPSVIAQPILQAPAYQYAKSAGYAAGGLAYQSAALNTYSAPAIAYKSVTSHAYLPPAPAYTTQVQAQKEIHGYSTSAGLSSVASSKTVTPLATYAQAPIIAKITAAPLVAKFALSPAKTSYVTQNLVSHQGAYSGGSYAKASLNSYSAQSGPVVTQVYAAPAAASYATSPALKVQQAQVVSPLRYTAAQSSGYQYSHAPISGLTSVAHVPGAYSTPVQQYATSVQVSAPSVQYAASAVNNHAAQALSQYTHHSAPVVRHYAAPVAQYAAPVAQYAAPVSHYAAPAVQYATPAISHNYASPAVAQYAAHGAPSVAQYAAHGASSVAQYAAHGASSVAQYAAHGASSVAHVSNPVAVAHGAKILAAPAIAKNVHSEFVENYDAHPRYTYEYAVNDPHTGDIKQQKEERDGEVVKGQYSLVEPDGSVRTVEYVADWETGFHANVRNSKDHKH